MPSRTEPARNPGASRFWKPAGGGPAGRWCCGLPTPSGWVCATPTSCCAPPAFRGSRDFRGGRSGSAPYRAGVNRILAAHQPYPGVVPGGHFTVLAMAATRSERTSCVTRWSTRPPRQGQSTGPRSHGPGRTGCAASTVGAVRCGTGPAGYPGRNSAGRCFATRAALGTGSCPLRHRVSVSGVRRSVGSMNAASSRVTSALRRGIPLRQ